MTKTTNRRKNLVGASSFRAFEPVTTMAKSTVAGSRNGTGVVAESSHLETTS